MAISDNTLTWSRMPKVCVLPVNSDLAINPVRVFALNSYNPGWPEIANISSNFLLILNYE
jgi:hypothetical protein